MVEVVPSDAGTSTETNDRNGDSGRNSPASAVCYQEDSTLESQTTRDGAQSIPTSSHEVVNPSIRPAADHDSTPHSKASSVNGPLDDNHHDEASFGFLSPVSSQDAPPPSLNTSTAVGSIVEPTVSNDGSISHLDLTSIASSSHIPLPHRFDHHLERPMPHHTYSSTSTASTATIRASDHTSRLPESETPQKRLPTFPNQSYTALQTQQHPPPHPPYLRSRSSNPSPYLSYVSGAKAQLDHASSTPSGSRTAGNSPSGSPGLFTPAGSPVRPRSVADDVDGSYSSPFLHYTQRHVPKE